MSKEQLKILLEKVKSDIELREKLKAAATADEAIAIAKEAGFSIVAHDFQSSMDDTELESAAGGFCGNTFHVDKNRRISMAHPLEGFGCNHDRGH